MFDFAFICLILIVFEAQNISSNGLENLLNVTDEDPSSDLLYQTISNAISEFSNPFLRNRYNNVDLVSQFISEFNIGQKNEDVNLSFEELLTKYNRPYEIHKVRTEDGYILKMFRIIGNGSLVLLIPGLFASSDDFATAGLESGLLYKLSDRSCDLWVGNTRGNKYSRDHEYLDPSSAEFWNFSFHENGVYDLPALIDYVLKATGKSSLTYIGHSQGTTAFFALASEKPEYNAKISQMAALSPVAYLSNTKSILLKIVAFNHNALYFIAKTLGIYEILADNRLTRILKRILCEGLDEVTEIICANVAFLIVGFDNQQINATNLPVIFKHYPSGGSLKQVNHFAQEVHSGRFAKYDNGPIKNLEVYGSAEPPEYNVSKITAPVHLFYSDNDWIAQPEDVDKLASRLCNVVQMYKVPLKSFNHLDFLFAKDVVTLLYDKLISSLQL